MIKIIGCTQSKPTSNFSPAVTRYSVAAKLPSCIKSIAEPFVRKSNTSPAVFDLRKAQPFLSLCVPNMQRYPVVGLPYFALEQLANVCVTEKIQRCSETSREKQTSTIQDKKPTVENLYNSSNVSLEVLQHLCGHHRIFN